MTLLTLQNAHLAFGLDALLDCENFALEAHERVGLIGRNGQGKSSLLKVLAQTQNLDSGTLHTQTGLRNAFVAQEPSLNPKDSVFEAVAAGLGSLRQELERYTAGGLDTEHMAQLHNQIEAGDGWNWQQRVDATLSRLRLDGGEKVGTLSGGRQKRVALAQALVQSPDVLLLDEPTNHLDLDSIVWLSQLLVGFAGSLVVVSHDRSFLDEVSTRIIELDRGKLSSYAGNLSYYLRHKEEVLAQEVLARARSDKLLAQEEAWIRQGVAARRTRSVARVARLEALRQARQARRDRMQNVRMAVDEGEGSGKCIAELEAVCFSYETEQAHGAAQAPDTVVENFNALFLRGDKVGIIGPNGCGKTTLLKLILGQLQPDSGKARQGRRLQIAYFDQMRAALDESASLEGFISPGSEWIEIAGKRKHVKSYLGDFLFAPERAHTPVSSLSGGERNRLLLARLFALPANVLVLDEPTNDLDLETIDLLESLLQNYEATVFLVSHDRQFLNNVVTSTIAFEGQGRWREYVGGVGDYLRQKARTARPTSGFVPAKESTASTTAKPTKLVKRKLSYKEQNELAQIPRQIKALEIEQAGLRQRFSEPYFYTEDPKTIHTLHQRDADIEAQLQTLLERWEVLEQRV